MRFYLKYNWIRYNWTFVALISLRKLETDYMRAITRLFMCKNSVRFSFLLVIFVCSHVIFASFSELDCKHSTWIHIPKTASSFCLTLQHTCCEVEFAKATQSVTESELVLYHSLQAQNLKNTLNFSFDVAYGCAYFKHFQGGFTGCSNQPKSKGGTHSPLPLTIDFENISVIALFREPKSRILSSFLDARHHEGMSEVDFKALQNKIDEILEEGENGELEKLLKQLLVYASHPHMMGCQVKMVMGYECSAPLKLSYPQNQSFVDQAVDRMNRFFFVGLTDYYNVSVDLFHKVSHHGLHASIVEKMPVRTSRSQKEEESLYKMFHWHDPVDDHFYQKVKERFISDVKAHEIDVRGFHNFPTTG